MALPKHKLYITLEEYIEGEKESNVKHEYVDGQVYAMAGASDKHNRISLNIAARLNNRLSGNRCETFVSDMKVVIEEILSYYPDVMVTCDDPIPDAYYRTEPCLIIEVLSPSSERIDRYEKLTNYRRIETLQEYVLVAQERMQVEVYRRQANNQWTHEVFTEVEDEVRFDSVGLSMSLADIYRNVRWTTADEAQ